MKKENIYFLIQDISEKETYRIAYYLYRLYINVNEIKPDDPGLEMFSAVVTRLKKEKRTKKILNMITKELINEKFLTPVKNIEDHEYEFYPLNLLNQKFEEDTKIFRDYDRGFDYNTLDLKLLRCLFFNKKYSFTKILALSIFSEKKFLL